MCDGGRGPAQSRGLTSFLDGRMSGTALVDVKTNATGGADECSRVRAPPRTSQGQRDRVRPKSMAAARRSGSRRVMSSGGPAGAHVARPSNSAQHV